MVPALSKLMLFNGQVQKDEQPEETPLLLLLLLPHLLSPPLPPPTFFPLSPQPPSAFVVRQERTQDGADSPLHGKQGRLRRKRLDPADRDYLVPPPPNRKGLWSPSGVFESRGREAVKRGERGGDAEGRRGSLITCCWSVFVSGLV